MSSSEDFTQADEPFSLFEAWFTEALATEPNDPNAMALATLDPSGMPNVRMVLLKGLDLDTAAERGFVFYTNAESAKGQELNANPNAALLFHWKSLRRQVRVRGPVLPMSALEADAYFASRPRGSQIGAWASQQSRPLDARSTLEAVVEQYTMEFGAGDIPRPSYWRGFRVLPLTLEFWADGPFRLHDRIVFERWEAGAPWVKTRLYP